MKKTKKVVFLGALVLVGAVFLNSVSVSADENLARGRSLAEARMALEQGLLPLAGTGVLGIAHSEAEGQIVVFVEDEKAKERVPCSFEGCPVRREVIGTIRVFSTQLAEPATAVSQNRQSEVRPLVGGTSLSAYVPDLYYAGTLGMVTYDNKMLSNAHVIAMAPRTGEFLNTGTPIAQPGSADGGRLCNRVGELESYVPIDFGSQARNYADAAVGSIDEGIGVSPGQQFNEVGNYRIEGWAKVSSGDIVRKSGIATGVTTGRVAHTNASLWVEYGDQAAYFVDQILVEQKNWSFAAQDDSGSAVDKDGGFAGLVLAGSDTLVAINKAEHIIGKLGIAVQPMEGQYSLTLSGSPGGSVTTPGESMFIYNKETVVDLVAEADEYYEFVEWVGDTDTVSDVHAAATTIRMNGDCSITANFEQASNPPMYPTVTTQDATGISPTSATLNMQFSMGNYTSVQVRFAYKKSADSYWSYTDWASKTADGAHSESLTELNSDTEYEYTAQLKYNNTLEGSTLQFTTAIPSTPPPGAGCFIATAAYGTPTAHQIDILREFRDVVLLENTTGSQFVALYYRLSPPIADFISANSLLRTLVRELVIDPIVWAVEATESKWQN